MAKIQSRVIIASIVSTAIVVLVLLMTFKLTERDCELIIEADLKKTEPKDLSIISASDLSVLIRFKAHFEYITDSDSSSKMTTTNMPIGFNMSKITGILSDQDIHEHVKYEDKRFKMQKRKNKRFLPFVFNELEVTKLNDTFHSYILRSKCSTVTFIIFKDYKEAYVRAGSVDLKIPSNKKMTCELNINPKGSFRVKLDSQGVGHYACTEKLIYRCDNKSKSPITPLAELVIKYFQYEIRTSTTNLKKDFIGQRNECRIDPRN